MSGFRCCILFFLLSVSVFNCNCQEYDFAAEISRQCLVPDPVGLLDCVENKVTLPYLTSWVDCTNSLGQNVRTSTDIINYRCKSVWEGKGVIPEVFYIKDCVIEKTGLPAKNVSAEVLGAYKECESSPNSQQQRTKTAPVQQQRLLSSGVEYKPPSQVLAISQPQQFAPTPQFQTPVSQPIQPIIQPPQVAYQQIPAPRAQLQAPVLPPQVQIITQRPPQQQFVAPVTLTVQPPQEIPRTTQGVPSRPQYSGTQGIRRQPFSQQYFAIYPQTPFPNQQVIGVPVATQKTANPSYINQQQIISSIPQTNMNKPYSYYIQIHHPPRPSL